MVAEQTAEPRSDYSFTLNVAVSTFSEPFLFIASKEANGES